MEQLAEIQLGILFVLFGGFILVDPNSTLPIGLDFLIMVIGVFVGIDGGINS